MVEWISISQIGNGRLVAMIYSTKSLIEISESKLWHAVFINDDSELQVIAIRELL